MPTDWVAVPWRRSWGTRPAQDDDQYDPIRQVPLAVPVWCVHAAADDVVPISQSRDYVAAARAAGAMATMVEVPGDHDTVIDPSSAGVAPHHRGAGRDQ